MAEYIERELLEETLHKEYCRFVDLNSSQQYGFVEAIWVIKTIPSAADVAPVRHGKNIGEDYADYDQFICSECGIELQGWYRVERYEDNGDVTYHEHTFNYCPNCGAMMDGGTDNG